MDSFLCLRIRKRTVVSRMILLIVLFPFVFGLLDLLALPYALRYLLDLVWIFLLFLLISYGKKIDFRRVRPLVLWTSAFAVLSAILYVFHYQSLAYYIWAVRNNFRYYPFFLAAAVLLKEQDAEDCLKWFDRIFWINGAVCLLQYFCFGYESDRLGGLFGISKGCNGYMNIFFVIVVTKALIYCLNRKEKLRTCAAKCGAALVLAALAELKFFFLEFMVIVVLALLFSRFSGRSLLILLGSAAALLVGVSLLVHFYPHFAGKMTLAKLYETASDIQGYTSQGDMNRLTFLSLSDRWFLRDLPSRLFGLGLGNCETSNFDFFNTRFYQRNQQTHYTWLSTAMMYLEMGYVGLFFLFGFFALNAWMTAKREKRGANKLYCQMGKILSLCAMMILIYNSSMRTEAAYMLYLLLALPYIKTEEADPVPCFRH